MKKVKSFFSYIGKSLAHHWVIVLVTIIATAGAARTGTLAAVSLIMILVPIVVFIISQSQVMETMASSGMK